MVDYGRVGGAREISVWIWASTAIEGIVSVSQTIGQWSVQGMEYRFFLLGHPTESGQRGTVEEANIAGWLGESESCRALAPHQ